nr:EamA family transporter RarD [Lentibacillus saliphilus]
MRQDKSGMIYATLAYFLWGLLPIYWKLVDRVPAIEILAHRVVWSFVFMSALVILLRKNKAFFRDFKALLQNKKQTLGMALASIMISINWLTYIWAVNSDHVVQASLGYYINPLVSILLGVIVLREKLSRRQMVSFMLAAIGVLYLTFSYGVFPWISILLAVSFGLYGLLKKTVQIGSVFGLTIETMFVAPIAVIFLLTTEGPAFTFETATTPTGLILIGAGAATAIPLLLFASGARRIPLSMIGFLQYLAPTIMLILGVFVYGEVFSQAHLIAFSLIWTALFIYMGSALKVKGKQTT